MSGEAPSYLSMHFISVWIPPEKCLEYSTRPLAAPNWVQRRFYMSIGVVNLSYFYLCTAVWVQERTEP